MGRLDTAAVDRNVELKLRARACRGENGVAGERGVAGEGGSEGSRVVECREMG